MADDNDNKPNPAEAFQNLLAKNNNDGIKLASQLFDENFTYRTQIRELTGKQPADGATVLSAEEAKEYRQYQQFLTDSKLDLKQIKASLEKMPTLEAENAKLVKRDSLREVAATGWDLELLEKELSAFPDAVTTVKKVKDGDKEVLTPFITLDGKESSLDDFGKEKFPKLLPVLKVSEQAQTKTGATYDPPPHGLTKTEVVENEVKAQAATGRYAL